MPEFSIGIMDRHGSEAPEPMAYVTAESPDSRITGVHTAGDEFLYVAVMDAISDLSFTERGATPLAVAVAVAGRNGTVHQVMDDGTLRGWRRDYAEPDQSFSDLL